jgi:hypothetical protein
VLLKNIGNIGNVETLIILGTLETMKCRVKKLCTSEHVGNVEH